MAENRGESRVVGTVTVIGIFSFMVSQRKVVPSALRDSLSNENEH